MSDLPPHPADALTSAGRAPLRADHAESRVGAVPSRADRLLLSRMPVLPDRKPTPEPTGPGADPSASAGTQTGTAVDAKTGAFMTGAEPVAVSPRRRHRWFVPIPAAVLLAALLLVVALLGTSYLFLQGRGHAQATPPGNAAVIAAPAADLGLPAAPATAGPDPSAATSPARPASPAPSLSRPSADSPSATAQPGTSASSTPEPGAPTPGTSVFGKPNPDGADLARRAVATSSSDEVGGYGAAQATDGNRTRTRWSSGFADPQWIQLDLRAAWQLSQIRLYWARSYGVHYRIDASTDGRTWSTIWIATRGQAGIVTVDARDTVARYVRMYGENRFIPYGCSLYEFEVR